MTSSTPNSCGGTTNLAMYCDIHRQSTKYSQTSQIWTPKGQPQVSVFHTRCPYCTGKEILCQRDIKGLRGRNKFINKLGYS